MRLLGERIGAELVEDARNEVRELLHLTSAVYSKCIGRVRAMDYSDALSQSRCI